MNKITLCISATAAAAITAFAAPIPLDDTFPGGAIVETSPGSDIYEIQSDITLDSTTDSYILMGSTLVKPGVTLTIEPGVVLRGQPFVTAGDIPGSILVTRGGTIDAEGTAANPIIMTTAMTAARARWTPADGDSNFLDATPKTAPLAPMSGATPNNGLWGALTLLGSAPTNLGANATSGVAGEGTIEGYSNTGPDYRYGGRQPNDSSGTVKYVSIRHSGQSVSEGDEQQGLTLGGVGYGTLIDYVDIYCTVDDGIEIFGGTAAIKHFMISYCKDDALDMDQGYTGFIQFGFVMANDQAVYATAELGPNTLGEWDGDDASPIVPGTPFASPTIYNVTFFGGNATVFGDGEAFNLRNSFGGDIYNCVVAFIDQTGALEIGNQGNSNATGFGYPSTAPTDRVAAGTLNWGYTSWWNVSGNVATDIGANATADAIVTNDTGLAPGATNNIVGTNLLFGGTGAAAQANAQGTASGVNPVPFAGVNVVAPYTSTFFDAVPYRGAFESNGSASLWTSGWTAMNLRGILVTTAFGG